MSGPNYTTINFQSLFKVYSSLQSAVAKLISCAAGSTTNATPGRFLMIQFQLSQTTQIGDSISNLMAQLASSVNKAIGNFRTGG
ncbi:MAG: hypothetical protein EBU93_01495 [Chlamydiae bacterium]|jgi:hypothetical protein|nr:hypothetical protein [Chlamydiota bacterium]